LSQVVPLGVELGRIAKLGQVRTIVTKSGEDRDGRLVN